MGVSSPKTEEKFFRKIIITLKKIWGIISVISVIFTLLGIGLIPLVNKYKNEYDKSQFPELEMLLVCKDYKQTDRGENFIEVNNFLAARSFPTTFPVVFFYGYWKAPKNEATYYIRLKVILNDEITLYDEDWMIMQYSETGTKYRGRMEGFNVPSAGRIKFIIQVKDNKNRVREYIKTVYCGSNPDYI